MTDAERLADTITIAGVTLTRQEYDGADESPMYCDNESCVWLGRGKHYDEPLWQADFVIGSAHFAVVDAESLGDVLVQLEGAAADTRRALSALDSPQAAQSGEVREWGLKIARIAHGWGSRGTHVACNEDGEGDFAGMLAAAVREAGPPPAPAEPDRELLRAVAVEVGWEAWKRGFGDAEEHHDRDDCSCDLCDVKGGEWHPDAVEGRKVTVGGIADAIIDEALRARKAGG